MSRRVSPIGLDIGSRCVKAVQLSGRAGHERVCAAVWFDRAEPGAPASEGEMRRIDAVLGRSGFSGTRCVLGMDRPSILTAEIELPPEGTGAPREQIARLELARTHRREPGGFEMGLWEVPAPARSGGAAHAMVVACPHERADAVLDGAERAGLDVLALDHPGCALARLVRRADPGSAAPRAILDLGWSAAVLVLVREGTVLYERVIDGGAFGALSARIAEQTGLGHGAVAALMSAGELWSAAGGARRGRPVLDRAVRCVNDYAETVGRELRLSLDYLAHRFPSGGAAAGGMDRVDLAGGGAACPSVIARLAERSGVALRAMSPADVMGADSDALVAAATPALCLAAGLALRDEGGAP